MLTRCVSSYSSIGKFLYDSTAINCLLDRPLIYMKYFFSVNKN